MNNKIANFFFKILCAGKKPYIHKTENGYWITDGCVAAYFHKNVMVFNPTLFKESDLKSAIDNASGGTLLSISKLRSYQPSLKTNYVPLNGLDDIVWIDEKFLNLFPTNISLFGKGTVLPVSVVDYTGETIGIIMPVRNKEDDLFGGLKY